MQGAAAGNMVVAAGEEPASAVADGAGPAMVAELLTRPAPPAPLRLPLMSRLVDGWPDGLARRLAAGWSLQIAPRRLPLGMDRLSAFVAALDAHALVAKLDVNGVRGLIAFDRALVLWLIDRMLGGRGQAAAAAAMERPLTLIEKSLMQPVIRHTGEALVEALAPAGALTLGFAGWEEERAAPATATEGDAALVLALEIGLDGGPARVRLALPLAGLEPLRAKLAESYPGAALGQDPQWRRHMAASLGRSRTQLTAVLHEIDLPLARIRALAVGETLLFEVGGDPLIEVRAGEVRLGVGRLGRSNGRVAVRLETALASAGEGAR
jgi:flagellar motor switch protein FliM